MQFFDRLFTETRAEREAFIATPVIQRALRQGVPAGMYVAFLGQAYHHVRHTCRLLSTAAARCTDRDQRYINALLEYINEERGHEEWILDDIRALGGDADAVRTGQGDIPCRLMVAYVYYAIEHVSPYAMLGMVHVLEGMSAALATAAAGTLKSALGIQDGRGFSYLGSHGSLDQEHVAFFRDLVNGIDDPAALDAIVETARVVYRLYGDMFSGIEARYSDVGHAA
ncbi:MAG: iron-containing redox enzyme family protein [Ferrovibrio sp.]